MTSITDSGFGTCSWDEYEVRQVTRWPSLQPLLHFCFCISLRQEEFCFKYLKVGGSPHPSTGDSVIYWKWFLWISYTHCWTFCGRSSPLNPGASHIPGFWDILDIPHHIPLPCCSIFPFILLSLWFIFSLPTNLILHYFPPPSALYHTDPCLLLHAVIVFFLLLSSIEVSSLSPIFLLNVCSLWVVW